MGVKTNGMVIRWGEPDPAYYIPYNSTDRVLCVAAASRHTVAVRESGEVVVWGESAHGQQAVPEAASNGVAAVAAWQYWSMALRTNRQLVAWGDNTYGQCSPPPEATNSVIAMACGAEHGLSLTTGGALSLEATNAAPAALFRVSAELP